MAPNPPSHHFMLAIGLPIAREEPDEDSLDREDDDRDRENHDLIVDGAVSIVRAMRERGHPAITAVHDLARALDEMADAVATRNDARLERAANDACEAMHQAAGKDEGDHEQ